MGATPSKIGYVRKGCARGLTKLGVSYLTVLARPSTLARLWPHVSVGYGNHSLLPSEFLKIISEILSYAHILEAERAQRARPPGAVQWAAVCGVFGAAPLLASDVVLGVRPVGDIPSQGMFP